MDGEPSSSHLNLVFAGLFVAGLASLVAFTVRAFRQPQRWTESAAALEWRPFPIRDAGLLLAVWVGGVALFTGFIATGFPAEAGKSTAGLVVATLFSHGVPLGFVCWLMHRRGLTLSVAFGGSRMPWAQQGVLGIAGYLAMFPVSALVYQTSLWCITLWNRSGMPYISTESQDVLEYFAPGNPLRAAYAMFTVAVLAPVAEEVVFRGILFPALARRMGALKSALLVSLVFAAIHFHASSFLVLFVFGVVLSAAFLRTRSLLVPIVMHMAFNLVAIMVYNLGAGGGP